MRIGNNESVLAVVKYLAGAVRRRILLVRGALDVDAVSEAGGEKSRSRHERIACSVLDEQIEAALRRKHHRWTGVEHRMEIEFAIGDALGSDAIANVVLEVEVPLELALLAIDLALEHHFAEVTHLRKCQIGHIGACLVHRPLFRLAENYWLPCLTE